MRCSGYLLDNPQDAIRVRANYYAASGDKSRAAPIRACKDRHSFGHNLAGARFGMGSVA
jgi:hypothetical protein